MFKKIYVEITNICNLSCSFCPKTRRTPKMMTLFEFEEICKKLMGHTDYIYLHVMGEPLIHTELDKILSVAEKYGFKVCITTNGTLLSQKGELLLSYAHVIHKVSISVHSVEGNGMEIDGERYLRDAISFSERARDAGIYTVFRLWNLDTEEKTGANSQNGAVITRFHEHFNGEWVKRHNGYRMDKYIFLEFDGIFTWPVQSTAEPTDEGFCFGLGDQIGILADGTVVPCCLDGEGKIPLGNIFDSTLDEILSTERVQAMIEGFKKRKMTEDLCKTCTFARRFSPK